MLGLLIIFKGYSSIALPLRAEQNFRDDAQVSGMLPEFCQQISYLNIQSHKEPSHLSLSIYSLDKYYRIIISHEWSAAVGQLAKVRILVLLSSSHRMMPTPSHLHFKKRVSLNLRTGRGGSENYTHTILDHHLSIHLAIFASYCHSFKPKFIRSDPIRSPK